MKHNYFILSLLVFLIQASAIAQTTIKNQKTIGGSGDDDFSCMYLTKDGGLIAGGSSYSDSSGEKTENNRGSLRSSDYWVIKLDDAQNIQWDKTIGGSGRDYLTSIQQTTDAGYILGGYSSSDISGEKTEHNRGSIRWTDYWIVKLDSAGKIQWDKTIGGSDPDYLDAVYQTKDGGYILGGYSLSDSSGEKTENNRGARNTTDYWVVKLDAFGKKQWDKTIGGSLDDYLFSLQQTKDGGYILGGYSLSDISTEKTENSRGDKDYWVVKLDSLGKIQWDKTIGGNNIDILEAVQQTTDGGYILGGSSSSDISGEKTDTSRGWSDYWVVKLDSIGNIQWDKTIGARLFDDLHSLQQTSDGGYILGGSSNSHNSRQKTEDRRGMDDYWIVKLSSTGYIQGDKTIGGDRIDRLYSIREIEKDHYALGGVSESTKSGDKTQGNRGVPYTNDYWLVELVYKNPGIFEIVTAQNANIKINEPFTLYPNPAKDILHIQLDGKATLSLTNQSGKVLLTKTINGNGVINVAALPAGLYYLKNTTTGEVQKIVVTK